MFLTFFLFQKSFINRAISNVRRAFAAFDKNGDGIISQDEFRSGCRRLDLALSEIQITACFDVLRSNNNSGINYNDFTTALQNR